MHLETEQAQGWLNRGNVDTVLSVVPCVCSGYHSAALYHALRGAVQPLTELLTDDEYKTRANAAGALGNLVRNSSMLCAPIVQARALQVMLQPPPCHDVTHG